MENQEVTEKQSNVLVKELLTRYTDINDKISDLLKKINTRYEHPDTLNFLTNELKYCIVGFIGIAQTNGKFYSGIEKHYLAYVNLKIGNYKKARYNAETTIEIWEIIKKEINTHKLIELTEGS